MSEFRYTRPDNFPPIIKNLIIINVLVWVVQLMFDQQYGITDKIALYPIQMPEFKPYQIATHMFAHSTYSASGQIYFAHIVFNMFALWMFGKLLENVWGSKRFLFFYLACGIGAAAAHMAVQYFEYREFVEQYNHAMQIGDFEGVTITARLSRVVGASGAVVGVMVAFAFLFPNTEMGFFFLPVAIKAKWIVLALIAVDLFGGFNPTPGDDVAHFAHLGGALTGFIIVLIWNKTNRRTFY